MHYTSARDFFISSSRDSTPVSSAFFLNPKFGFVVYFQPRFFYRVLRYT